MRNTLIILSALLGAVAVNGRNKYTFKTEGLPDGVAETLTVKAYNAAGEADGVAVVATPDALGPAAVAAFTVTIES